MAIIGIAKNIPEIPEIAPPIMIPTMETNAFIWTFELTTNGTKILLSINCTIMLTTITPTIMDKSGDPVNDATILKTPANYIPT